jgi:hypothetical protein
VTKLATDKRDWSATPHPTAEAARSGIIEVSKAGRASNDALFRASHSFSGVVSETDGFGRTESIFSSSEWQGSKQAPPSNVFVIFH